MTDQATQEALTLPDHRPAVAGQVEQPVRPAAWVPRRRRDWLMVWEDAADNPSEPLAPQFEAVAVYTQAEVDLLVAAARDRMLDLCAIDMASATLKASELAQAAERERCAKVAEGAQHLPNDGQDFANGWCSAALQIAQAIRQGPNVGAEPQIAAKEK